MIAASSAVEAAKDVTTVLGLVLAAAGAYAFLWAGGKVKGTEKTIELLRSGLDAVNDTLEREREERERERDEARREADAQDRACAERLAELKGRVDVLTSNFGEQIAAAIVTAVRDELRRPNKGESTA